jgi:hypothetical protein
VNRRFAEFVALLGTQEPDRAAWIEPGFLRARALLRAGAERRIQYA